MRNDADRREVVPAGQRRFWRSGQAAALVSQKILSMWWKCIPSPGAAVLRSKDPEGVAQEMWALFAVYQAIHTLIGAAVDATGIPPDQISFPHALAAATDSVMAGFSPSGS